MRDRSSVSESATASQDEDEDEDEYEDEYEEESRSHHSDSKENRDVSQKERELSEAGETEFEFSDDDDDAASRTDEFQIRKQESKPLETVKQQEPHKWLEEEREKYIWELKRLKKYNSNLKIEFDEYITPTLELVKLQNNIKRELILDRNVSWCKNMLCVFWNFLETIIGPLFGRDWTGFSKYQQEHMYIFEDSLNEIYERNYLTWIDKLSPELRILLFTGMNLLCFENKKIESLCTFFIPQNAKK